VLKIAHIRLLILFTYYSP